MAAMLSALEATGRLFDQDRMPGLHNKVPHVGPMSIVLRHHFQ